MPATSNYSRLLLGAAVPIVVLLIQQLCFKKVRRTRKLWARKWLQRRDEGRGVLSMVEDELRNEDPVAYKQFLRMCAPQFDELLDIIRPSIARQNTNMRESVSPEKRLALTYLATGESYRSLMFASRIHESTISIFIPEVCSSIYKHLKDSYLKLPTSQTQWQEVAISFERLWNFPLCMGAMDGKHINFRPPRSSGSYYYNYKGDHSIVLYALVGATYNFLYIDVGVNGRVSDGGVYRESSLKEAIDLDILDFPPNEYLSGVNIRVPYTFVADEAFPLTQRIMKPFRDRGLTNDKRIFNYRLSRARRVVENAFGIMANRFRILLTTIPLSPDKIENITLTCCVLHNYLISKNPKYMEVEQTRTLRPLVQQQGGNRSTSEAQTIREAFVKYFNNEGAVAWQSQCLY